MTTVRWQRQWRVGRLQVKVCLLRHRYSASGDRWVFQPSVIFDRAP